MANWYLESYRETGDSADITRAEQAARASLKIRPTEGALLQLSRALLNQHRFAEALAHAKRAATVDESGHRLAADIAYEIGDYAAAEKELKQAPPQGDDPAFYALMARFSELKGDGKSQLGLLAKATQQADANVDSSPQSLAYFHERYGARPVHGGPIGRSAKAV